MEKHKAAVTAAAAAAANQEGNNNSSDQLQLLNEEIANKHVLVVKNLQCWANLAWNQIGGIVRSNRSIVVIDRDIIGVFTVRGISFALERGKKMLIVGSNSSGASSLVKNVLGWQKILSGEVFINGENCSDKFFQFEHLQGLVGY